MNFKEIVDSINFASHHLGIKKCAIIILLSLATFAIDQLIKLAFIEGLNFECEAFTLGNAAQSGGIHNALVYNTGVAFSLFAFLGEWLKYIQLALLVFLFIFSLCARLLAYHTIAFGLIFGAGASNVFDRFVYGGVVDYVYWHYGFEWAIFNFADVMIDLGVGLIIIQMLFASKKPNVTN